MLELFWLTLTASLSILIVFEIGLNLYGSAFLISNCCTDVTVPPALRVTIMLPTVG